MHPILYFLEAKNTLSPLFHKIHYMHKIYHILFCQSSIFSTNSLATSVRNEKCTIDLKPLALASLNRMATCTAVVLLWCDKRISISPLYTPEWSCQLIGAVRSDFSIKTKLDCSIGLIIHELHIGTFWTLAICCFLATAFSKCPQLLTPKSFWVGTYMNRGKISNKNLKAQFIEGSCQIRK